MDGAPLRAEYKAPIFLEQEKARILAAQMHISGVARSHSGLVKNGVGLGYASWSQSRASKSLPREFALPRKSSE